MTYEALKSLIIDAEECATLEQFLTECGSAYPDGSAYEDGTLEEKLTFIFSLREGVTFRKIFEFSGMKISEWSREYDIPRRTVDNWLANGATYHEPPQYLTLLLLSNLLSQ